jgi:hypothetical protein
MDPITQVILTFVSGLLVAIVTSIITVRLSLKQFYSQKWWENKWEYYSKTIESLYHIRHYEDRLLASEESGVNLSDRRKKDLEEKTKIGSDEIDRIISIGGFIVSKETIQSLLKLRKSLESLNIQEMSFYIYLDKKVSYLDNAIREISKQAKKDLER